MNSNKTKNPDVSKAQGKSNSDVLQFTCCCACNGTFQQVIVKGYGNWTSAKGRCFMPFSNCAPLYHVIFVLTFCLFIFLLMYYNVACQITGSHKIHTNESIKDVKSFHLFSNSLPRLVLLPGMYFAHSRHGALVWMRVSILSIIS